MCSTGAESSLRRCNCISDLQLLDKSAETYISELQELRVRSILKVMQDIDHPSCCTVVAEGCPASSEKMMRDIFSPPRYALSMFIPRYTNNCNWRQRRDRLQNLYAFAWTLIMVNQNPQKNCRTTTHLTLTSSFFFLVF